MCKNSPHMTDDPKEGLVAPEIPVEVEPEPQAPIAESLPPVPSVSFEDRLAALDKEKKDLHDRLLRTAADFDNFRKRARKDQEDARLKAREEVIKEILPVMDNLERALSSTQGDASGVVEGVKLVLRQFQSVLERFEIKAFSSVGEVFDPSRHEAISQIETSEAPAGTVFREMQKGYVMGTRLVRPALVAVAKAPPSAAPPEPEEAAAPEPPSEPAPAVASDSEGQT
jgi:molecular chaperone GrpE